MKIIRKSVLKIICGALTAIIAVTAFPYIQPLLAKLFDRIDYTAVTETINHEMRETGKLATLEYSDTSVLTASVDTALIKVQVAQLTVNYKYEISFGIDLKKAQAEETEDGIVVYLPKSEMLSDDMTVLDDPKKKDFWNLINEKRYQKMLNDEKEACRKQYTDDPDVLNQAWENGRSMLEAMFESWLPGAKQMNIRFEPK